MSRVMSRRVSSSRRLTALLCVLLLAVQTGCYSYLPIQETAPSAGQAVAVILSDEGRQLVRGRLGELVERVDGTLLSVSDAAITMSVTRTLSLRGVESIWAGEQVEIPRVGIRGFRERQLSRSRTTFLTVGLIVGVAALISGLTLAVGGTGRPDDGVPCPPLCDQQ